MIRDKATAAARAVIRNRNTRLIAGAACLAGVLMVLTEDLQRSAYLAVVTALTATVILKLVMVIVMRRAKSELPLDDAMTDNQASLAAERMVWLSILLAPGLYAYDPPLWRLVIWVIVSVWVIETDTRVIRCLWQEGLFPQWRMGGDSYSSLGQAERTVVAVERQADATERIADQADAAFASGQVDVAEQVETGRADGHAAGRLAERVGVNAEVQAGHDAGLAEGRAEQRPQEGGPDA